MKALSILAIIPLLLSCNLSDTDSAKVFSIKTEKSTYLIDSTTVILTIFTNDLDNEVKIYSASCGGPSFIVEKNDGKDWNLFGEQLICDQMPYEPISLADGNQIKLEVRIILNSPFETGLYRMKFEIKESRLRANAPAS